MLGGYSLGGADLLRRAMGKKKPEEMATHRAIFRDGAAKKGIAAAVADEVFDLMEKFAGYGFNKSHAAAYSLLAYHTAWIKVHHPAEFFAANMTVEIDNSDKLKALLVDAKSFGVVDRAARRQHRHLRLRAGLADGRALRPRRGQGHGARRDRGDRRRARSRAARSRACSTSAPASTAPGSTAASSRRWSRRAPSTRIHAERSSLLASVGLALDWADTQAAHADQGGLFDFGADDGDAHGASTQEPAARRRGRVGRSRSG